jgi:RNA polymerase sigma-70 factor (ECF subfamily)
VEPEPDAGRWLSAARAGSAEALGKALETCRNYLLLIAGQQLAPDLNAKGDASDLVQETFLEAQRDFARFQGDSEAALLAWLRQILVHNAASFARRYRATGKREIRREVPIPGNDSTTGSAPGVSDPLPTPSSRAMEKEQAQSLQEALARLPDDYRQAIVLRYLEGRTFEEIGARLNRSPDAARKLWSRALERLRHEWEGPA